MNKRLLVAYTDAQVRLAWNKLTQVAGYCAVKPPADFCFELVEN